MKTKNIIWLFSMFINGPKLLGKFCQDHGLVVKTTGDWQYFGDIANEADHIAALLVDADQFDTESLQGIVDRVKVLEKAGLFHGRIVFLSKKQTKVQEVKKLHRICLPPKSRPIADKLSHILHLSH